MQRIPNYPLGWIAGMLTKEEFSWKLAEVLKWGFPKADDPARQEMDAVALQIAGWIEELIDTKIEAYDRQLAKKDLSDR